MSSQILQYNEYVTLIGGGNVSQTDFDWSISRAPGLLAADGGADRAISLGRVPDAAIGDFDSISPQARAALPADAQYHIAEQDSTDFDKCLRVAQAPLFVGLGFLGPRSDHQLAALTTLARNPDKRIILVDGEPAGAINRVPAEGEARSNMHVGGTPLQSRLTDREKEICARIGPELKRRGMIFVGIDVIGGLMTEINVTSPTGIQEIDRYDGSNLSGLIWDAIEAKVA